MYLEDVDNLIEVQIIGNNTNINTKIDNLNNTKI